jgi:hypothetical protein
MMTAAQTYVDDCKDQVEHFESENGKHWEVWRTKLPTIEGLARILKVARSTVYKWADESPEFSDIIEDLLAEQSDRLINQGLAGNYNSTIAKLLLSSKHGYVEKTEQDITTKGEAITPAGGTAVDAFIAGYKDATKAAE